ncbi:unnamed protein product, partial [Amoebophrya sp. A120]|eukprot:GSA120T00025188001.1
MFFVVHRNSKCSSRILQLFAVYNLFYGEQQVARGADLPPTSGAASSSTS